MQRNRRIGNRVPGRLFDQTEGDRVPGRLFDQTGFEWTSTAIRKFDDLNNKWSILVRKALTLNKKGLLPDKAYEEIILNYDDYRRWKGQITEHTLAFYFGDFSDEFKQQSLRFNKVHKLVAAAARAGNEPMGLQPVNKEQFENWLSQFGKLRQPIQGFGTMIIIGLAMWLMISRGRQEMRFE